MHSKIEPLFIIPSLEELDEKIQQHSKLGAVTRFIRLELEAKQTSNPQFETIKEAVLNATLKHQDVLDRDKSPTPLSEYEEKYFRGLLGKVIGGCTSPKSKSSVIEDLKAFINSVFANQALTHLRNGTLISFLRDYCFDDLSFARLAPNTLRKVIKQLVPATASRRGRSHPNDLYLLKDFVESNFGFKPVGI